MYNHGFLFEYSYLTIVMICRIPMLCISVGFAHLVTESDLYIQFAFEAISLIKYFDISLVLVN